MTGADADLVVVDRAHRRHLDRRAGHEDLVGHVEVGADQRLLDDRVAEVLGDLDDRVARDPGQDRRARSGVEIVPSLTTKIVSPGPSAM